MATIATAGLSSLLSQITYTANSSRGPTAARPGGFVCVCQHLPSIRGPLPAHFSYTIQIPYYMSIWLAGHRLTCSRNRLEPILMLPMLTRTHPDDADVD
jgi:hypothetical protein